MRQWVPILLAVVALALLPWTLWLATTLPTRHVADHWDVAWGGFDVILSISLLATAAALFRWHRFAQGAAMATGALLVADAWFDVTTSKPNDDLIFALVLAVLGELPLATLCFWIGFQPERFYANAPLRRPWPRSLGQQRS